MLQKQTISAPRVSGAWQSTDIEQFFFGRVDTKGRDAIEYFGTFAHPDANEAAFHDLLNYMSVQKLRTPKGLALLADLTGMSDSNAVLLAMQQFQNMQCAIWTRPSGPYSDATHTQTKFILSDHPVTVYSATVFPAPIAAVIFGDPDIRLVGTHTIFPLSPTRALVLTNHSWVRNPYVRATRMRPNPHLFRTAMFYFPGYSDGARADRCGSQSNQFHHQKTRVSIHRRRRRRMVISGAQIPSEHWRKLDDLYLLMPDPRSVTVSEEIILGYNNRPADIFDAYGRRPGQPWLRG